MAGKKGASASRVTDTRTKGRKDGRRGAVERRRERFGWSGAGGWGGVGMMGTAGARGGLRDAGVARQPRYEAIEVHSPRGTPLLPFQFWRFPCTVCPPPSRPALPVRPSSARGSPGRCRLSRLHSGPDIRPQSIKVRRARSAFFPINLLSARGERESEGDARGWTVAYVVTVARVRT